MDLESISKVDSDLELDVDIKTQKKRIWKKIGEYRFSKEIGRGAFSVVYKGRDANNNKYAIKQVSKGKLTPFQLSALKEEINILQSLQSEHIIKLYNVYQTISNYYLVLEYCSGGDLDQLLGKRLPESQVQRITHQLAKALKTLMDKSIFHRDLKLSNILVSSKSPDAVLKLADFGLARKLNENEYTKTFCGTPLYMAPEILAGESYNLKSDLWSIGIMMYQFLTGKFPFEGATPFQVTIALDRGVLTFPEDVVISEHCIELIKGLLQVDPAKRIEWEDFFEHPFVLSDPKEQLFAHPLTQEELKISSMTVNKSTDSLSNEEQKIIDTIETIRLKASTLLKTFYNKERVIVIETCTKEIFDILWKLSKRLKPIIALFAPKKKALILCQDGYFHKDYFMKIIDCGNPSKERLVHLSPALIAKIQTNERFQELINLLISDYETIISNLVGYAEVINLMQKYDSVWNLFKYALALGHEGDVLENNQKEPALATMKYLQAFLVIELILSEAYHNDTTYIYKMDTKYKDCQIVDDKGAKLMYECTEGNIKVENTVKIKALGMDKLLYLRKLRNELKIRCTRSGIEKHLEFMYSKILCE